jgi:hypothetical protein
MEILENKKKCEEEKSKENLLTFEVYNFHQL